MPVDWKKRQETLPNQSRRPVVVRTYEMPDGRLVDFEIKKEGPAVAILALTPSLNVILARQFRPGPERVLLELPGGGVGPGEDPDAAAERELLEETGCTGELIRVGMSLDCAYSTMQRYNYVALNCHKVQELTLDPNEFIEVVERSMTEFRELLRSGQLSDIESGYLGLDFLGFLSDAPAARPISTLIEKRKE